MTKNLSASSFGKGGVALALGATLLATGMPAQAQWLVQDNNLYELVESGIVEQIKTSGNGKGSFKASSRTSLKKTAVNAAKSALGLGSSSFEELAFDTEALLNKSKEDDPAVLETLAKASSVVGSQLSSKATSAVNKAITGTSTYSSDAGGFFGNSLPSCNYKNEKEIFVQCMHMRNILGSQLKEVKEISKILEDRNMALQGIMAEKFKTPGELQKKQYEISVLQTVIANDQMRLQTALASYQAMRDMYKEKYNEALNKRKDGGGGDLLQNAVKTTVVTAAGTAAFKTTKSAMDSQLNPQIFKK